MQAEINFATPQPGNSGTIIAEKFGCVTKPRWTRQGILCEPGPSRFANSVYIGRGSEGVVVGTTADSCLLNAETAPGQLTNGKYGDAGALVSVPTRDMFDTSPYYPVYKLRALEKHWLVSKETTVAREVLIGRFADDKAIESQRDVTKDGRVGNAMQFVVGTREWFVWASDNDKLTVEPFHIVSPARTPDLLSTTAALLNPLSKPYVRYEVTNLLAQDQATMVRASMLARAASDPQGAQEWLANNKGKVGDEYAQWSHTNKEKFSNAVLIMRQPRAAVDANSDSTTSFDNFLVQNTVYFTLGHSWRLKVLIVSLAHQLYQLQHQFGFIHGDIKLDNLMVSGHNIATNRVYEQFSVRTEKGRRLLDSVLMKQVFGTASSPKHLALIDLGRAGIDPKHIPGVPVETVSDMVGGNRGADMRRFAVYLVYAIMAAWQRDFVVDTNIVLFCANTIALPAAWVPNGTSGPAPAASDAWDDSYHFRPTSKTYAAFLNNVYSLVQLLTTIAQRLPTDQEVVSLDKWLRILVTDLNPWSAYVMKRMVPHAGANPFADHAAPSNVVNMAALTIPVMR